ncbi:MAG: 6-pyruvoyl-tetrahydropterin synthase-related protein [Candidatus Woesearchaeota archaeon]
MELKNKTHLLFIGLIVLLTFAYFNDYFTFYNVRINGDLLAMDGHVFETVRKSIVEYKQFPHWVPYYFGGNPLHANSQPIVISYTIILLLLAPTVFMAMNMSILLNVILSGVFMYLLIINLKIKPRYAFISAILYAFNSFAIAQARSGQIERGITYAFLPLLFLFCYKSLSEKKSRDWIKYSILAGIVLAVQFLGSGHDLLLMQVIALAPLFLVFLFSMKFFNRLKKSIVISIIILIFFFGFASIKLLPMLEFTDISSKNRDFSYEESVGHKIEIDNVLDIFKLPLYANQNEAARVGLIAYLLILLSLFSIRNKKVMTFWLILIFTILIASGSGFYLIFWKYVPGFDKLHHVARSMFIAGFAFAALAGIGSSILFTKLSKRFNWSDKRLNHLFIAIVIILSLTLLVFEPINYARIEKKFGSNFLLNLIRPLGYNYDNEVDIIVGDWRLDNFQNHIDSNQMMNYLSQKQEKEGLFRIHNIESDSLGGIAGTYASFLDLQILMGSTSIWIPEYFNTYLGISHNSQAKFYGMLNTKYVYSKNLINVSGLEFVKEFEKCDFCRNDGPDISVDGPYLYENALFLPRAYFADNSILIIGDEGQAKNMMYGIMLDPAFDPSNTVIILKTGSINQLNQEFINRFSAIFLVQGSVDQGSEIKLRDYISSGGVLAPNIIEGENSVSNERLLEILASFKGDYNNVNDANIEFYSPNKMIIDTSGESGFLVLSEKFFLFEGWKAKLDNQKLDVLRANGINSAVYIDSPGNLNVFYSSKTFNRGLLLFIITLIICILFFIYPILYKKAKLMQE